jgi:hypothetical protein
MICTCLLGALRVRQTALLHTHRSSWHWCLAGVSLVIQLRSEHEKHDTVMRPPGGHIWHIAFAPKLVSLYLPAEQLDVGAAVGAVVGSSLGAGVGASVGLNVGAGVGCAVGASDGADVGPSVGILVGASVGASVGISVGASVG